MVWMRVLQKKGLTSSALPTFPFFVFGPAGLIKEVSNIGPSGLDGKWTPRRISGSKMEGPRS